MNKLFCFSFSFSLCVISFSAFAVIDTKSAGYSKTFVDFNSPSNFNMKIERAYNSRSIYKGLFGFGWCSNFETKLVTLPDNSLKVIECGGGMEILYYQKNKTSDIQLQTNIILKAVRARNKKIGTKKLKKLKADLLQSQTLRAEFLKSLDIEGKVSNNVKYYAEGRFNEFVVFKNKTYHRTLPNGVSDIFDSKGRLLKVFDKFGNYISFIWKSNKIQITTRHGKRLTLNINPNSGLIKNAVFQKKIVASYQHNSFENLTKVLNHAKEKFFYAFDDFHNLLEITYPDKTKEILTYDTKKDWVLSFQNRKGCLETYDYGKNPKNSNHYFSTVEKKCGRKIVNKSKYEFWNKPLPNGKGKYLHRARARVNGKLTDVIYHPKFGTPISFLKNGVRTKREYYSNGLLKLKDDIYRTVEYKKYSTSCRKPEHVEVNLKDKTGKILSTSETQFQFKPNCQLILAKKSPEEWIKVGHDDKGRLSIMEDQSRKVVTLGWNDNLNKPELITRKGVGSIQIVYDESNGQVTNLKGSSGPSIMAQVSSVFNSFLQILSPVAEEIAIL